MFSLSVTQVAELNAQIELLQKGKEHLHINLSRAEEEVNALFEEWHQRSERKNPTSASTTEMSQIHSQANTDVGDSQSESIQLIRSQSKKRKAVVWQHFNEVGEKAVCKHCNREFTIGPNIGTTHLNRHIEKRCREIDDEERALFTSGQKDDLLQSTKFNPELTRDLMTMLFIDAEIPFSVIESRFWEPAMRSLRPEYRAIRRQTLRNDCVGVFKAGSEVLMKEFEELDTHISFTSDIWTSSVSLGYLCVTAHYIDKSFNLHKRIISFSQIPYPHSGPGIASAIKKAIFDWKLDQKVFAITLDNCSANINAISFLENIIWDKPIFEGENMHMRCGAHILNIMVQDGMEILRLALTKIREMMRYISSSGQRLQTFNEILDMMHLPSKRGLILDCPTRWNSTYEMVSEALKYKDALLRYGDGTPMSVPSLEEWNEAVEMEKFLRVFLDATKAFSTFRRPSSHAFLKEVWTIRSTLLEDYTNPILRNLSKEMLKKFYKYLAKPNGILTLACVFDPRYKLEWVDFCFGIAYGEGTDVYKEMIECVQTSLKKWYREYESTIGRATTSISPQVEGQNEKQKKLEMSFQKFRSQNRQLQQKRSKLDNYLEDALVLESDEEFDILQWWRKNSELCPTLGKMARDFLAVQVSTVASESAFSGVGRLTDHLWSSMTPETIEALICSKDWFAAIDGSFNLDQFRPFMPNS